jgi:hypothetical protein
MEQTSDGHPQTSPAAKEEGCWQILLLVNTNSFVKELTLFLPGLTLLQSSRNKFLVAWLEIFRPAQDIVIYGEPQQSLWRPRHYVMRFMKTSNFALPNSTSTARQNCHQVSAEARIKEMKESRTRTNHDPRMNRISSIVSYELHPNTASTRSSLVLEVPFVLDMIVWRLPCVFLACVLLPCACACFWPLSLKNPLACKTQDSKHPKNLFSLSSIYVSSGSIDKLKVKH